MKTIGLIGGMSWESTVSYYQVINRAVQARLGGFHSAKCVMVSVDFDEIEALQRQADWPAAGITLAHSARQLEAAGAECVLLCTNTMHICASVIESAIHIPFIHIADATAASIQAAGISTIGLLGTRFTMEQDFYRGRLEQNFSLNVLTPTATERDQVHRIIYDELVLGKILTQSREIYRMVIEGLIARGAQGIIFGCTEIGLLVDQGDSSVPVFDTTLLHAQAAVDFALK